MKNSIIHSTHPTENNDDFPINFWTRKYKFWIFLCMAFLLHMIFFGLLYFLDIKYKTPVPVILHQPIEVQFIPAPKALTPVKLPVHQVKKIPPKKKIPILESKPLKAKSISLFKKNVIKHPQKLKSINVPKLPSKKNTPSIQKRSIFIAPKKKIVAKIQHLKKVPAKSSPTTQALGQLEQRIKTTRITQRIKNVHQKQALNNLTGKIQNLKKSKSKLVSKTENKGLDSKEIDLLSAAVSRCFVVPLSLPENSKADVMANLSKDGTVLTVTVIHYFPQNSHGLALANSAERALLNPMCNPLPIPKKNYRIWQRIAFHFTPTSVS